MDFNADFDTFVANLEPMKRLGIMEMTEEMVAEMTFAEIRDVFDNFSLPELLFLKKFSADRVARPRAERKRERAHSTSSSDGDDDHQERRKNKQANQLYANINSGLQNDTYKILPLHPKNWGSFQILEGHIDNFVKQDAKGFLASEAGFIKAIIKDNFTAWSEGGTSGMLVARRLLKLKCQILFPTTGALFDGFFEDELLKAKANMSSVDGFFKIGIHVIQQLKDKERKDAPASKNWNKGGTPRHFPKQNFPHKKPPNNATSNPSNNAPADH